MNWHFWRKAGPDYDAQLRELFAWEEAIQKRGFSMWIYNPPPSGTYVEVARIEWPMIQVWGTDTLHPETNIANLWWRQSKDPDDSAGGIIEVTQVDVGGIRQYQVSNP